MESNCPVRAREVPAAATRPWPIDAALWPAVDDVGLEPDDADDVAPVPDDADDVAPEADGTEDGGFPTASAALICAFCDELPPKPPLPKAVPPALGPVLDCEGLYAAKSF
jgi:hypothetical protein